MLAALNWYLSANVLLILAYTLLSALGIASDVLSRSTPYRAQIGLGRGLTLAAVLLPFGASLLGYHASWATAAHIWSATSMEAIVPQGSGALPSGVLIVSTLSLPVDRALHIAQWFLVAGFFFVFGRALVELVMIAVIISCAHHVRRSGRLWILASDRITVPFSFWLPSRCFVVVPAGLLLRLEDFRLAICHEAQHHRQFDTRLLYVQLLYEAMFFWNPVVHWLDSRIRTLQELACDEATVLRKRIPAQQYCESLLRIAESAVSGRRLNLSVGMLNAHAAILNRRIERLIRMPPRCLGRGALAGIGVGALLLMGASAYAFSPLVQDRRVSMQDAVRMAAAARSDGVFPITVNSGVLRQLNRWLATPDGRSALRDGLSRLQIREDSLSEQLARSRLPSELLAVPLVESGYRNLKPGVDPRQGAGLWMFIAPTARRFGLIVDASQDERLNERAETEAALRMFAHLHRQFDDWQLTLLSYNVGSPSIEAAIRKTGSHDAWRLAQEGYENDPEYLSRVMAAVLIIKNPRVWH
jgi:membrane-bound lytic murein transglycosylase D